MFFKYPGIDCYKKIFVTSGRVIYDNNRIGKLRYKNVPFHDYNFGQTPAILNLYCKYFSRFNKGYKLRMQNYYRGARTLNSMTMFHYYNNIKFYAEQPESLINNYYSMYDD